MLGKHLWELAKEVDSVWTRFFRGVYPHWKEEMFGNKEVQKSSSYFWKGLWKAREVMKTGLTWAIGNGKSVKVASEPWISHHDTPIILNDFIPNLDQNMKVEDLILDGSNMWNVEKIHSLLPMPIAKEVLEMKPRNNVEDTLVWKQTRNTQYSVKTGYKGLAKECGETSNGSLNKKSLEKIWKLKVPAAVQMFVWKLYVDGLLTGRKMIECKLKGKDTSCSFCGEKLENAMHLFFRCKWMSRAWLLMGWRGLEDNTYDSCDAGKIRIMMDTLLEECSLTEMGQQKHKTLFLLHAIWNCRNNQRFNNKPYEVNEVVEEANRYWRLWKESLKTDDEEKNINIGYCQKITSCIQYVQNHEGSILHSDGSFDRVTKKGAAGVVLWKDKDHIQAISAAKFQANEALEAEVLAVEHAGVVMRLT